MRRNLCVKSWRTLSGRDTVVDVSFVYFAHAEVVVFVGVSSAVFAFLVHHAETSRRFFDVQLFSIDF